MKQQLICAASVYSIPPNYSYCCYKVTARTPTFAARHLSVYRKPARSSHATYICGGRLQHINEFATTASLGSLQQDPTQSSQNKCITMKIIVRYFIDMNQRLQSRRNGTIPTSNFNLIIYLKTVLRILRNRVRNKTDTGHTCLLTARRIVEIFGNCREPDEMG